MSYCHQPMSVVCCVRQQFSLSNIFSETARPRALIFGMKHCLVDFTKFVQMMPLGSKMAVAGGLEFENKICLEIFSFRTARLRCMQFGM